MAHWEQGFDVYMGTVDGRPASFVLDMRAAEHAPVATHPVRLHVRVKMSIERPDGLRDADELEALGDLEDLVVQRLEAAVTAIYVGRMVHDGYTELYFYVPSEAKPRLDDLQEILGEVPRYEPEWLVEDDEMWTFYEEFLYPDVYAQQSMQNRKLLAQISEHGDANDISREIDHVAIFHDRTHAETAAARLAAAGFRVDDIDELEGDGDHHGHSHFGLQFHRDDRLDGARPDEFCAEILSIVLEHEGDYDGWGTPIVKP